MDDLTVKRLNLWIKSLPNNKKSADELVEEFLKLSNKDIEKLDEIINQKPKIRVSNYFYRCDWESPSAFPTPIRSSKSSGAESMGYRSTP
jgi:hypothetical protein